MNREIKFRAYVKELPDGYNKTAANIVLHKILPVAYIDFDDDCVSLVISENGDEKICSPRIPTECVEIIQYTGLKDKNGKEIYEVDFLKCEDLYVEVKWNQFDSAFCFESDDGKHILITSPNSHFYEIIGNKFENPELMSEMK